MYNIDFMNKLQDGTNLNHKTKLIEELLKKQVVNEDQKENLILILNYLEHQEAHHEDDIYLSDEIKQLYDCIL